MGKKVYLNLLFIAILIIFEDGWITFSHGYFIKQKLL